MGYVKLAEDLQGDLGAPFGPLPAQLVTPDERIGPRIGPSDLLVPKSPMISVPEEGVEPPT